MTGNAPSEVSPQSGEEYEMKISGIVSFSVNSDSDSDDYEQSFESASESPSSDFSSTGLTDGQQISSTPRPSHENADCVSDDSNSGSSSPKPDIPVPESQHETPFEEVKKKRSRTTTYKKDNKRLDDRPTP
ncbi:hypothetical protein DPEC_G00094780 [Dallia pectoralis]|uniref:Uncharacterized protein n=1 Tax=Dallia pectoralis TaxID=75939 RepID=A0ACC2H1F7_DALPE|nr:hypothetical protein DPEC_G00094780 [Dallia pectoralis]